MRCFHGSAPRPTPPLATARYIRAHARAHAQGPRARPRPKAAHPTPTYFGEAGGDDGPVRLKFFLPLPLDMLARFDKDFFGCLADLESPMVVPRANANDKDKDSQTDFGRSTGYRYASP